MDSKKAEHNLRVLFNICLEKLEAKLYIKSKVYYHKKGLISLKIL